MNEKIRGRNKYVNRDLPAHDLIAEIATICDLVGVKPHFVPRIEIYPAHVEVHVYSNNGRGITLKNGEPTITVRRRRIRSG